ncbi:class I SAM-dependent methyltransferase [Parasphingorhabdus sp. DH2-15]|uniref:class I SAM-dependent methyltransferase n=1 Tax=Parasphingorhabdus sp. DH2-15 TaxID=3444112 RepID=UPI003F6871EB
MKLVRKRSMRQLPVTASIFRKMGVFPITGHYYEPLYDMSKLDLSNEPRDLPGIDFRHDAQLALLRSFAREDIPENWDRAPDSDTEYSLQNRNFGAGDADLWFQIIRHYKPQRIIEIGSGHSTRVAREAIALNGKDDSSYKCDHMCIEPYEMPWLEKLDIDIVRSKLEDVDPAIFDQLSKGDILFIDSSHMIRPGGEVLMEFLQIVPKLAAGVVVHVHDIFTPRDYPARWLKDPRFWNEQYLLEAFLSNNNDWNVVLGGNYMAHAEPAEMEKACRYFKTGQHNPGSFYMQRK